MTVNAGSGCVKLHSFAREIPSRKVTNDDLAKLMDTSDEWITKRTGIKERYWVEPPTTTSDLATASCRRSLEMAETVEVDAIIAATLSPDYNFPGIGVQVQNALGLEEIPAYDLRNQCSGFLYGVEMAAALISSGLYRRILLVGAEVHSTGLDISTRGRDIAVLFGDGAGSCILEHAADVSPDRGDVLTFLGSELHSDGKFARELFCEHPGSAHFPTRLTTEMVEAGLIYPHMNGRLVFENAVGRMTEVSRSLLNQLEIEISAVTLFAPHQANIRINQMVAHQLGLRKEQCFNTISQYGNTTAATIPIGLSLAADEGRLQGAGTVLSAAFGSGFTWGAAAFRIGS